MNIFEELRADHDVQRELIAELVETTGDSEERAALFDRIVDELRNHAAAEERHFYAPLMETSLTQDKARHSIHEHEVLDELVEKLESYDRGAPAWLETAGQLEHKLTHHLDEEEQEVFQLAGKALTDQQKADLASSYRSMMSDPAKA